MIAARSAGVRRSPIGARRIVVGIALAAVGIGCVFYAPAFALLILVIALAALWELGKLIERKGVGLEFTVAALAVTAYIGLTYLGAIRRFEGDLVSATVVAAMASATFLARGNPLMRSGSTLLGVLYIGKLLSYFIALRALPGTGIAVTIFAIVVVAMTDIAAMLVGVNFGRTPLTPLSPRKTVEGAVGGLVVAVAAAIACAAYLHWPWWQGVAIGALTSAAAQAGDLVESALKRDADVKDAGSAIGGHGGVLDRFDSYLFGGIAFYFALVLLGRIPLQLVS